MNSLENATQQPDTELKLAQSDRMVPVAPYWHTVVLVAVFAVFALLSSGGQRNYAARHGITTLYIATIIWEWLLVGYIAWGVRRRGLHLSDLVAGRWKSPSDMLRDLGVALAYLFVAWIVLAWLGYLLGLATPHAAAEAKERLGFLVPRTGTQLALFFAVSATAGICEEIIFRGYLQRQFTALTRSEVAAVVLQAVIFGAGHGYEGRPRMVIIGVYGAMFGFLALWRRSLRPGIMAHGLHDGFQGLLLRKML